MCVCVCVWQNSFTYIIAVQMLASCSLQLDKFFDSQTKLHVQWTFQVRSQGIIYDTSIHDQFTISWHHQLNTYGDTRTPNLKRYMENLDCLAKLVVYKENMVCVCMYELFLFISVYKHSYLRCVAIQGSSTNLMIMTQTSVAAYEELDANSCATAIHKAANYTAWESL